MFLLLSRRIPNLTRCVGSQKFLRKKNRKYSSAATPHPRVSELSLHCINILVLLAQRALSSDFEEKISQIQFCSYTPHPELSSRCTNSTLNMEYPAYILIITPCVHTYVLILPPSIPGVVPTVQAAPQMCKNPGIQFQSHTLFLHIYSHSHTLCSRRNPHCNSSTFKIEKPAYMYYHILYSHTYFHSHTLYSRRSSHCTNSTSNLEKPANILQYPHSVFVYIFSFSHPIF